MKKYTPTAFMAPNSIYSKAAADYAVSFIEALSHTKGSWAGKPFELIDWQEQIVRDVFGIIKPNGYRQFNTAYGGLDLSSTTDITAFVLVFPPEDETDKYSVLPFFWMPEDNIDLRERRDHVQYDLWKKQGYLLTTEGNVVYYGYIEKFIEELGKRYNIREIAI